MYNIEGKFFYEILEDYQNGDNKDEIFRLFCELIWNSDNERKVFTNCISFKTYGCKDALCREVFDKYKEITYIDYKRVCDATDFVSLLRQKLNNIYSFYCDKRICVKKDYISLLKYPKNTYFELLYSGTAETDFEELDRKLAEAVNAAREMKEKYSKSKINIGWNKYVDLINSFLRRCFNNYVPISQSESRDKFVLDADLWTDDNYCIKYFCKCLDGYFKNYQKEYYGIKQKSKCKECVRCGGLIELDDVKDICKSCRGYKRVGIKYLICCACGVEFEAEGIVKNKVRCDECQKKHTRRLKTEKQRLYRSSRCGNAYS